MYFKEYLNQMLKEKEMTQKALADSIPCDPSLVSYWCSGDRKCTNPEKRKRILAIFASTEEEKKEHLYFIHTGKRP